MSLSTSMDRIGIPLNPQEKIMTDLDTLLRTDPLEEAERITGVSYKENESTVALGLLLTMDNSKRKEKELLSRGDTTFSNELDRYISIIEDYGFEQLLNLPFEGQSYSGEPAPKERFFIYWHPEGLLLSFDTFETTKVNSAKVQYNWKPNDGDAGNWWKLTSSGGVRGDCWVGDHDAREALIHHMDALKAEGKFLNPWKEAPFMWLLHYMDTKYEGYDYDAINKERIAMLPEEIQKAIRQGEKS